jgi:hypothetical protein
VLQVADGEQDDRLSVGKGYALLFKKPIVLVDNQGTRYTVQYEGSLCAAQRHLRLTGGWNEFIRSRRMAIGASLAQRALVL